MEKKIVIIFCACFSFFTLLCMAALFLIPDGVLTAAKEESGPVRSYLIETVGEHDLCINLPPEADRSGIVLDKDDDEKSYTITIPGFNEDDFYDFPMEGKCKEIKSLNYSQKGKNGIFVFETDMFRKVETSVGDNGALFVDIYPLREFYDHIIVVDAGHGGDDTGAVAGDVKEKDINLEITKELKALLDKKENIKVFYTRLEDENVTGDARSGLVSDTGAELLLSIHMGATSSGRMSEINGARVLYKVADVSGRSKKFASICLGKLTKATGCGSRGVVAGDGESMIRNARIPVAIVECGSITNEEEQAKLVTKEYRKKCAKALYSSIMSMLSYTKKQKEAA